MFGIRRDIVISVMLHSLILAAAFLAGSSSEIRNRRPFTVSLLEELRDADRESRTGAAAQRPVALLPAGRKAAPQDRLQHAPVQKIIRKQKTVTAPSRNEMKTEPPSDRERASGSISIELHGFHGEAQGASAGTENSAVSQGSTGTAISSATVGSGQHPEKGRQGEAGDVSSLRQGIKDALQANLIYPYLARKRKMEGTVLIAFRINQKGLPESIRVRKGSGYSMLDAAAQDTVFKASPFPALGMAVEVPITFTLKDN